MTANGEVQTREEATVYVKEVDLLVTVKLLEDTPAVLTVGKLCEDHGYSHRVDQWSQTTTHQRWQTNTMQHGELRANGCPWFIDQLLKLRLHQFGKKVLPGIFLCNVLYAEEISQGDIMVADIEELEKTDTSEIHAARLNAKEVLTPKNGEQFIFPDRRWNSQTFLGGSGSENIHLNPGQPRQRRRTRQSSRRIRRVFYNPTSRLIVV